MRLTPRGWAVVILLWLAVVILFTAATSGKALACDIHDPASCRVITFEKGEAP